MRVSDETIDNQIGGASSERPLGDEPPVSEGPVALGRLASPLVKAVPLYAVGLFVMLAGATQTGVEGLVAVAVLVVGLAVFSLGIVLEERADRSRLYFVKPS